VNVDRNLWMVRQAVRGVAHRALIGAAVLVVTVLKRGER
jgi:hypothetical protein